MKFYLYGAGQAGSKLPVAPVAFPASSCWVRTARMLDRGHKEV